MGNVKNSYVNALLADASYVELADDKGKVYTDQSRLLANLKASLTEAQAKYILDNFEIVTQKLSANEGFDATVWRVKPGSEVAGSNQFAA